MSFPLPEIQSDSKLDCENTSNEAEVKKFCTKRDAVRQEIIFSLKIGFANNYLKYLAICTDFFLSCLDQAIVMI